MRFLKGLDSKDQRISMLINGEINIVILEVKRKAYVSITHDLCC